jgi:hypothetical protein
MRRSVVILGLAVCVIVAAAGLVYSATTGDGRVSAASMRQHYYDLGKQDCARVAKSVKAHKQTNPLGPGPGNVMMASATIVMIHDPSVPHRYQAALHAGCHAALG